MTARNNGRRERHKQQTEAEKRARMQQHVWEEAVSLFREQEESRRLNKWRRLEARREANQQRRKGM